MRTPSTLRRLPAGRSAAALALASLLALPTSGHLSIIRQGSESAASPEAGDNFGRALCAGDFNGDGWEDLATAAPNEDVPGLTGVDHGAVIVNFGSEHGLSHVGAQLVVPQIWLDENNPEFGRALACADFDSDGYDDLVVGVPYADELGVPDAGIVLVYRGGVAGLAAVPNLFNQSHFGAAIEEDDAFGYALAAGDINGDGNPDLVIGSPGENSAAGQVFFVYGTPFGLSPAGVDVAIQATYGGTDEAGDNFGYTVAIGQLVGDGTLDVAVGAPFKDQSGFFAAKNTGLVAVFECTTSGADIVNATTYTPSSLGLGLFSPDTNLGRSLATGNFRKGAWDELAIGRPGLNNSQGQVVMLSGGVTEMFFAFTLNSNDFGIAPRNFDRFGEALAAGDYDGDGDQDLVVGSPGHTPPFTTLSSAGRVYVYLAEVGTVDPHDSFTQPDLGETTTSGHQLGYALTLGEFDSSGRDNIAAGSPFASSGAGQVHIIAPWRQVRGLHCETSIAMNCDGEIVFSQKPFDPVFVASTTKTMTVLLAAERTMLPTSHPDYLSPNTLYLVPEWVADNIGGSQFGLVQNEIISLQNLMAMTMAVSGNDCAFAIGDLLSGGNNTYNGIFDVVPGFIAQMNARAQQLGMFDTTFNNPAGLSGSSPESTAYDMALLSRAAMQNPVFANVVGTSAWSFSRLLPQPGGVYSSQPTTVNHWFVPPLRQILPEATGIKGGGTPKAKVTGVYSAQQPKYPWGTAVASTFATPDGDASELLPEGAELLKLGLSACPNQLFFLPPEAFAPIDISKFAPLLGNEKEFLLLPPPAQEKSEHLWFTNLTPDGLPSELSAEIQRTSTGTFEDGVTSLFQTDGVMSFGPITIVNEGDTDANVEIFTNAIGDPEINLFLEPGESGEVPEELLPPGVDDFRMTLTHFGNTPAILRVVESYEIDLILGDDSVHPTAEEVIFERDPADQVISELVEATLVGGDTDPGHELSVLLAGPGPIDVEPKQAGVSEYGAGWPGRHGVPVLRTSGAPVQGTTFDFELGNSLQEDTSGFWAIGLQMLNATTSFDGTLHVKPLLVLPVTLPATGLAVPYPVATDPALCGLSFYHQLFVVDPDASQGLSFSRGLQVQVGL